MNLFLLLALAWVGLSKECTPSYSLFIPSDGEKPQDVCRGKRALQSPCTRSKPCNHSRCRKLCNDADNCKFYFYAPSGRCIFYEGCKPTTDHMKGDYGSTYGKICKEEFSGTVGVSWANFGNEERWQRDSNAIKREVNQAGGVYMTRDAGGDADQQIKDIEDLIAQNVDSLIILAEDASKLGGAMGMAKLNGIPVIAYDRLIDFDDAYYITFDNVEVGRLQAKAVLEAAPKGNYVMIKGAETDPNSHFLRQGQQEVLQDAIDAGNITILAEAFTPGWSPQEAEKIFEAVYNENAGDIQGVVASNDGTAGGVIKFLMGESVSLPVSGQDGETAALNRVAKGSQTVSVWKDARELGKAAGKMAIGLAKGRMDCAGEIFTTPTGKKLMSILLDPVAITDANLGVVLDANWINEEDLCEEVDRPSIDGCPDTFP